MRIQTTEKARILHLDELEDLVDKIARSYIKRVYSGIFHHVFGTLDDVKQVIWTRFLEAKQAREIIQGDIAEHRGLLTTIAKRGLVDYTRTHLGRYRDDKKFTTKNGILASTYYMDYYESEDGGMYELPLASDDDTYAEVERKILTEKIQRDIYSFINSKTRTKGLSKAQLEMIWEMMHQDFSMREIAKTVGVTESRVSQIHKQNINRLRKKYAAEKI